MIITHPGNFGKYAYLVLNTVNETGGGGKYLRQSGKWKNISCSVDVVFSAESWLSALFPLPPASSLSTMLRLSAPAKTQR